MKNFFVICLANKQDGTVAAPVASYESETDAWKEFYRLCGQAVDSAHLMDSVTILTKQGFQLDYKCFEHEPQPQPEPEAE